jgi:hypothetical protein
MRYLEPTVSPRFGLAAGLRLWRLVLAVWIVPVFLAMPVLMMVRGSFGRALAAAPETAAGRAESPWWSCRVCTASDRPWAPACSA